ncbi:hypothetical protein [Bradyrhizobium sp. Rc2d]|uniref:hypothetical protein n=1 Tax=Bradyrhizobium sp. Rc2d TaxID=1855321 RepID=UPI00115FDB31|nr:hypothetical protein [Bradyrhizobium sp. Rc2d]
MARIELLVLFLIDRFGWLNRRSAPVVAAHASGLSKSAGSHPTGIHIMPDLSNPNSYRTFPRRNETDAGTMNNVHRSIHVKVTFGDNSGQKDNIEQSFLNVFAIKSAADRERMIAHWMSHHGGSRTDAMRILVEQWRRDNRS